MRRRLAEVRGTGYRPLLGFHTVQTDEGASVGYPTFKEYASTIAFLANTKKQAGMRKSYAKVRSERQGKRLHR